MENLILGNKIIRLDRVESTNSYLQEILLKQNCHEGLVVIADYQTSGRGQRGSLWESEIGKNLIFSFWLKPMIEIENQFLISKVIALGVVDFLKKQTTHSVHIKWPNDILINYKKAAGILIENTLDSKIINGSVVGIGLNVNQDSFGRFPYATSLSIEAKKEFVLEDILSELLKHIEVRYFQLKNGLFDKINSDYLNNLLGYQKVLKYSVVGVTTYGEIAGVSKNGKLQLKVNSQLQEYDLKEISLDFNDLQTR